MDRLPEDVLIDILSRLPIKSLMRCRCVCESWLNLTRDRRFTPAHLSRSSQTPPSLVLNGTAVFHGGMFFAELDQTHDYSCTKLRFSAPDSKEFRIVGSCNGLLCLVHHMFRYMIYVCNPFTGEYIKLPNPMASSQRHHEMVIGFGFSPRTNEYKIVEIIHSWNRNRLPLWSEVFVYSLGDSSWRDMGDLPYAIMRRSDSTAFVNGALHWVCASPVDLIVSFDIAHEVFVVIPRPELGQQEGCYSLGVLNGCLSITDSSFGDRVEIWVMKDYGIKESWTKFFAINFNQVGWNIRFTRTLCIQKDGKLLLLYNNQDLVLYDPQTERLRRLSMDGIPSWFEAVTHVASLVSPLKC